MVKELPLVVLTNDDGIRSPGLRAVVQAVIDLGELLIVAPRAQQSSMGRSFIGDGHARRVSYTFRDRRLNAFAVPSSPAVTTRHAALLIATRKPALVISGINYGENLGNGVTISGTIGAALEAANLGIPALAVSLETPIEHHLSHSKDVDFTIASEFTRQFAQQILASGMPRATDILNVNVPRNARAGVAWRWTRVSRAAYFHSTIEERSNARRFAGYHVHVNPETLEADSDIRAVLVDGIVSVSPLTLDLTAPTPRQDLERWMNGA